MNGRTAELVDDLRLILPEVAGDSVEPRPEIDPRRERRAVVLSGDEWAVLGNPEQAISPTPEIVQAWLDGNQRAPEAAWAARLVLSAREAVTSHARRVWAQKARELRADLLNGTPPMCECRKCESMTPIARLIVRDVDGGWAALAAAKAAKAAQDSGANGSGLTISWVPA